MGVYIKGMTDAEVRSILRMCLFDNEIIEISEPHGRLIEVTDKLRSELCWYETYTGIDEAPIKYAVSLIDDAPTVIEAEYEPQTERSSE